MNCSVNPRQSISLRVREPDSYDASFYDSAPGLVTPKAFQPIPLATFAFACVAVSKHHYSILCSSLSSYIDCVYSWYHDWWPISVISESNEEDPKSRVRWTYYLCGVSLQPPLRRIHECPSQVPKGLLQRFPAAAGVDMERRAVCTNLPFITMIMSNTIF